MEFRVHLLSRSDTLSWLCSTSEANYHGRQGLPPGERRNQSARSPEQGAQPWLCLLRKMFCRWQVCCGSQQLCACPFLFLLPLLESSGKRQRGDSNPCGQSPMDFESISLAARTHCLETTLPEKHSSQHQSALQCWISGLAEGCACVRCGCARRSMLMCAMWVRFECT